MRIRRPRDKNEVPEVSIVLPFYNRAATLDRCVTSVRLQTFGDWELIAVDDGSTDGSAKIVEALEDSRIHLLPHLENRGAAAARNTGLRAATGRYLALIDSDDEWLPHKLSAQLAALRESDARLCSSAFRFIRTEKTFLWPKPFQTQSWEKALHRECTFGFGSTLMVEREIALAVGEFDSELPRHEDWDWVLRAFEAGEKLAFVSEPLANVYAIDRVDLQRFIRSTHRFLAKHDRALSKFGTAYRRRIVAHHYESIASMAYENRSYGIGCHYLLRSFLLSPWRNPLPLLAVPLSLVDWSLRTRFIQRGAEFRRKWFEKESSPAETY